MKLPGFTGDASLYMARGVYKTSEAIDASKQIRIQKVGGIEPAVNCNALRDCCAQVAPSMRSLSQCCIDFFRFC